MDDARISRDAQLSTAARHAIARRRTETRITHTIACTSHTGGRVVGCESTDALAASNRSASRILIAACWRTDITTACVERGGTRHWHARTAARVVGRGARARPLRRPATHSSALESQGPETDKLWSYSNRRIRIERCIPRDPATTTAVFEYRRKMERVDVRSARTSPAASQ